MKDEDKKSIIKVDKKLTKSIDSLFKYREFLIDKGISEQKIAMALSSMTSLSMDFGIVRLKNGFEVKKWDKSKHSWGYVLMTSTIKK